MSLRRGRVPAPLPFCALDDLDGRRHVMADGAARPGSVLVLSHWPASPTPKLLWRDLSCQITLDYLGRPRFWLSDATCVTIDHLDEDGIASVFALVRPKAALRIADRLVAFAATGDFGIGDRDSARSVFAVRRLLRPEHSPWWVADDDRAAFEAKCAFGLLDVLEDMVVRPERHRELWEEDDASLEASARALADGTATIEERRGVALAIVRLGEGFDAPAAEIDSGRTIPLHPFALHAKTTMPRVLIIGDGSAVYYDRYETWVRFVSRRLPLRRNLQPLAERLTASERGATRWIADPPGANIPMLSTANALATTLSPEAMIDLVTAHLTTAPPAWDPFSGSGPLVPRPALAAVSGPAGPRSGTSGRGRSRS